LTVQLEPKLTSVERYRTSYSLVLIAICEAPSVEFPELATIRAFRAANRPVIAYGEDIRHWQIRARCMPLIAGAMHLLDSSRKEFSGELKELLRSTIDMIRRHAVEQSELKAAMHKLGIVAASKSMLDLFRTVMRFSQLSDLPVLITGETGTGKERFARALYELDPKRSQGPFVPVNCGALTSTLAESELFGHRRGSFTGAERDRRGLIRAAEGGVLFLDEVGELPEWTQTKLLRVIQENRVLAVGEEHEQPINVRIIAATNRDLVQRVEQGSFRADLFHRLNVLPLHIPPLRERREDIRPLFNHFVKAYSKSLGPTPEVAAEAVEALEQLNLPGNVRQLENIIRRALVSHHTSGPLRLSDLPSEVWHEVLALSDQTMPSVAVLPTVCDFEVEARNRFNRLIDLTGGRLDRSLDICERILVSVAFERSHRNQSETARLLHITPRSVYNKLRRHRLKI
jgi:DNA-binding NtrC family response regulator